MTPHPRPYFHRIESLRGLGALTVAGYHLSGWTLHGVPLFPDHAWPDAGPFQNALRLLGIALMPGHAALMMFFVISGFVLRLSLGHGPQSAGLASSRFVLSRMFRVYPIVFFAVAVGAIFALDPPPLSGTPQPLTLNNVVARMLLIDVSAKNELWALQVELLMVPIILVLYFLERSRGPAWILGIALAATGLSFMPTWAVWPPLSAYLFAIVLGMTVPHYSRRIAESLPRRSAILAVFAMLAVMAASGHCCGFYSQFSAILDSYAASLLIGLVAYRRDLAIFAVLDAKPLRTLGQSSGSFYVLHMTTATTAMILAARIVAAQWSATMPGVVAFLVTGGWLAAVALISIVTYHLIELPGIAMGRRAIEGLGLNAKPRLKLTEAEERTQPLRMAA